MLLGENVSSGGNAINALGPLLLICQDRDTQDPWTKSPPTEMWTPLAARLWPCNDADQLRAWSFSCGDQAACGDGTTRPISATVLALGGGLEATPGDAQVKECGQAPVHGHCNSNSIKLLLVTKYYSSSDFFQSFKLEVFSAHGPDKRGGELGWAHLEIPRQHEVVNLRHSRNVRRQPLSYIVSNGVFMPVKYTDFETKTVVFSQMSSQHELLPFPLSVPPAHSLLTHTHKHASMYTFAHAHTCAHTHQAWRPRDVHPRQTQQLTRDPRAPSDQHWEWCWPLRGLLTSLPV